MDTRLLELLVCPICKGPLEYLRPPQQERNELVCRGDHLAFPVRDGIPIMLESEARAVDDSSSPNTPTSMPQGATPTQSAVEEPR